MTKQELEVLNGLFSKKANLESRLNEINFPTDANYRIKSVEIEIEYYTRNGAVRPILKKLPMTNQEVKHYFNRERNKIMLDLFDVNHQIEKVKITK